MVTTYLCKILLVSLSVMSFHAHSASPQLFSNESLQAFTAGEVQVTYWVDNHCEFQYQIDRATPAALADQTFINNLTRLFIIDSYQISDSQLAELRGTRSVLTLQQAKQIQSTHPFTREFYRPGTATPALKCQFNQQQQLTKVEYPQPTNSTHNLLPKQTTLFTLKTH